MFGKFEAVAFVGSVAYGAVASVVYLAQHVTAPAFTSHDHASLILPALLGAFIGALFTLKDLFLADEADGDAPFSMRNAVVSLFTSSITGFSVAFYGGEWIVNSINKIVMPSPFAFVNGIFETFPLHFGVVMIAAIAERAFNFFWSGGAFRFVKWVMELRINKRGSSDE